MSGTRLIALILLLLARAASGIAQKRIDSKEQPQLQRRTGQWGPLTEEAIRRANEQIPREIERYKEMWQRLTPEQRNEIIRNGGPTPEQYERMFQQSPRGAPDFGTAKRPDADTPAKSGTSKPTDANQPANPGTIGSLQDSLRDLNAIRDANVTRVQKDVCPPEMAARMAELRTQIGRHEAELRGEIAAGQTLKTRPKANPLDTAANWFKAAVPAPTEGTSTKDQLIDSVLPNAGATERRTGKAEPTVEDPARRKTIEQEIARGKAELEQLRGACAAAKH